MTDILSEVDWNVRVSGLPHAMSEACEAAGLSPNAVEFHELTIDAHAPSATGASVAWPSYFCDKTGFVLVLAYLVRNNLPLELDIIVERAVSGHSRYRLHPALDPHSRAILASINPRQAEAIADLQARAEAVFARLAQTQLIEEQGPAPWDG
jgi:hypothetical protein